MIAHINKIIQNLWPNEQVIQIENLGGGFNNTVFLVNTTIRKIVIKCFGKSKTSCFSSCIEWEASIISLLSKYSEKVPKIIYCDSHRSLVNFDYIIISYFEGENFEAIRNTLSQTEIESIEYEIGEFCQLVSNIKKEYYYAPWIPLTHANNFSFITDIFKYMIGMCSKYKIDIQRVHLEDIQCLIYRYKNEINSVDEVGYCNFDLWDGNVIVKDGRVTGFVDFEHVIIGDKLITYYLCDFHSRKSIAFLKGMNIKSLSHSEKIRLTTYRCIILIKMIIEQNLRGNTDMSSYIWIYNKLDIEFNNLIQLGE